MGKLFRSTCFVVCGGGSGAFKISSEAIENYTNYSNWGNSSLREVYKCLIKCSFLTKGQNKSKLQKQISNILISNVCMYVSPQMTVRSNAGFNVLISN